MDGTKEMGLTLLVGFFEPIEEWHLAILGSGLSVPNPIPKNLDLGAGHVQDKFFKGTLSCPL